MSRSQFFIVYIEERRDEQRQFIRNVRRVSSDIKIQPIDPDPDIKKLVQEVFKLKPDACVVDYKLNESRDDIGYLGDKVIEEIRRIRSSFPCILLTNYESSAEDQSSTEPFKIYDKTKLYEPEDGNSFELFLRKLTKLIQFEEDRLQDMTKRFVSLKSKWKQKKLTPSELDELSQLNVEIEGSLDREKLIPKEKIKALYDSRSHELQDDLNNVIQSASELIKKFDDEN